jgi:hypothetical protein
MGPSLPTQIKTRIHAMEAPVHLQPKTLVVPSTGLIMLTVSWDSQEVPTAHFQNPGETISITL